MTNRDKLPPDLGLAGLDSLPYYVTFITADHHILWCNEVFASSLSKTCEECHGRYCPNLVHGLDGPFEGCPLEEARDTGQPVERDLYDKRFGVWIRSAAYPTGIRHEGQEVFLHTARDVTAEKRAHEKSVRLQEQRNQLQKLESAGMLSAGIVHDLNNLLAVTMLNASLLADPEDADPEMRESALEILDVTKRCAALTQRFLFLNRVSAPTVTVIDVNGLILDAEPLLNSVLGPEIRFTVNPGEDVAPILADATGFQQTILNLAVNARDAIEGAGEVRLSTRTVTLADEEARRRELLVGDYTVVRVSDTGASIEPEHLRKVFEPFFTTKEVGAGTGLGLKVVHDFVQSANGVVDVESAPGEGTSFALYLPATSEAAGREAAERYISGDAPATGTILIVTDQGKLGSVVERTLVGAGHQVVDAVNFHDALERMSRVHGQLDLAIIDGEPPTACREMARQLTRLRPGIRHLFLINLASSQRDLHDLQAELPDASLSKPFTHEELLRGVDTCLVND